MTGIIYDLISILPVSLIAVLLGRPYFAKDEKVLFLYIASIVLTSLCVLFYRLKIRGRILLGGITAALTGGLVFAERAEVFVNIRWILPVLVICIISFLIGKTADRYIKFRTVLAALFFLILIILMVTKSRDVKGIVVASLFYIIVSLTEAVQMSWKKEGDPGLKVHVVCMLPVILAVIIPLSLIKVPDRPYDWRFFKDLAKSIRTGCEILIESMSSEGWDGGDTMGFSDRGSIGKSISGEPYTVLSVSSDTENDYRLYLSGKTFDTFDGRKWEKTDESALDEKTYDLAETIAAIEKFDKDHLNDYLRNVMIRVSYEGIRTRHLFVPEKAIADISSMPFTQKGSDMLAGRKKKHDYIIRYYRLNRDDPQFLRMLENNPEVTDRDRKQALLDLLPSKEEVYSEEGYRQYRKITDEIYGKPVSLTARTEELLDSLFDGASCDFEKLQRIEKLLSSFKYTRNPGQIPENITSEGDFLDWFLFEKKEGFCTHFATAFVLMARSSGIPARYVQGYSTLSRKLKFEVASDRTHAWPEAYIEGFGWICFEPTPGYRQTAGWNQNTTAQVQGSGEIIHSTYEKKNGENASDPFEESKERSGIDKFATILKSRVVKIMAVLTAAFLVLFFALDRIVAGYRYSRMDDREKIFELCRRNMKLMKRAGYKKEPYETLTEYRKRLAEDVPEEITAYTGTYEDLLYSERAVFRGEVELTEQRYMTVRRYVHGLFWRRLGLTKKNIKKSEN